MRSRTPSPLRLIAVACATVLANGCGSGTTDPTVDPTINLSIAPSSATVEQGGSVVVTGTATVGGSFSGTATVTVLNVPTGVTGAVGAPQVSGNVTTVPVTINVGAAVAPDVYSITVRVAGSGVNDESTFALTVVQGPMFTLDVTPGALTIEQGTSGGTDATLVRTNFTGAVDMSAEGAPSGMSVSFNPSAVTGDMAALTVTVGGSVAPGTYNLTIRGQATGTSVADATDALDVTVTAPTGPAYSLSVTPAEIMLDQAGSPALVAGRPALASTGSVTVDITRVNGHTDLVALDLLGAPTGVTATFGPSSVSGATSDLTISVGPAVVPGTYDTTIRGQDGVLAERTANLRLIIGEAPGYVLGLDPAALSVEQGAMGSTTITLTRTNFAEAVSLSLEGAPSGVTGAFSVSPVTGTTSTLTLTASAMAAAGTSTVTIRGTSASLGDVTVTLDLTITEPVGFSLGAIGDITIQQGQSGMQTVAIPRTGGFAGAVSLTISPTVTGLTMAFDAASTTGDSFVLTATASGSLTPQTYTFQIQGNATGQPEAVTSVDVNVVPMSTGNVSLDFSVCESSDIPLWLAYQDGSGSWTQVTGTSNVYDFNVTQATVGVAIATSSSISSTDVEVAYLLTPELTGGMYLPGCDTVESTKTVDFMTSGLTPTEAGILYLGGAPGFFSGAGPSFPISNVPFGTQDAVGFVQDQSTPGFERVFLRRNVDVTDLGTVDFSLTNSEVVAAASATITAGGLAAGETYLATVGYNTSTASNVCQLATLSTTSSTAVSTFTGFGVPSGSQAADESHSVSLFATDASNNSRTVLENIGALSATTVTLPAALPAPTITDVGGTGAAYKLLQASVAMPGDYDSFTSFEYYASGNSMTVAATTGYLGSGTQTLTAPDLSSVSGFQTTWVPMATATVDWSLFGSGGFLADQCTVGSRGVAVTHEGMQN